MATVVLSLSTTNSVDELPPRMYSPASSTSRASASVKSLALNCVLLAVPADTADSEFGFAHILDVIIYIILSDTSTQILRVIFPQHYSIISNNIYFAKAAASCLHIWL